MSGGPLILLGMEIGDVEAITAWAREGHLPTIASILRRGCWGRIAGPERVCEHGTALSLFSGRSCAQHGHYYFRQLKPGTYQLGPVDAPETRVLEDLEGVQVANWSLHQVNPVPLAVSPAALIGEIQQLGEPPPPGPEFAPEASLAQDEECCRKLLDNVEKKGALWRDLLDRGPFDLCVAFFDESHAATHQYWKPRPAAKGGGSELGPAVRSVYRAIDRQLGLLLEKMPAANVVVFSFFGMQPQYPTAGLNEAFCRQLGYQIDRRSSRRLPRPMDLARRLIPWSWRLALGNYLSPQQQENLLANQLAKGTDWGRTRAFAIPSLYTGFVRVNLRGREPQGIVAPGAEYGRLLDELEGDLMQLTDPDTGAPAVDQVQRSEEIFGGGPPGKLPDLFVEWKASSRFLWRVQHPRARLVQERPSYCPGSEETLTSFIAAAGPAVGGQGDIGDIDLGDLAPTFLTQLGVAVPPDMGGEAVGPLVGGRS